MNRFYILCLLMLSCCCVVSVQAEDKQTTSDLVFELTQLRHGKMPLKATMPAVELLKRNPQHTMALNFLRKDFEKAEQKVQNELEQIAFANTLEEAQRRYQLVRLLADAYEALESLNLPLEGEGWSWHPGIKYYAGSVTEAQTDLIKIAEHQAGVATNHNDPKEAYRCYQVALECLTDSGEVHSNRQHYARNLLKRADELATATADFTSLSLANEFYSLAAKLNPEDETIFTQKAKCTEAMERLQQSLQEKGNIILLSDPVQEESVASQKEKYTFADFFDALDLPTVLGVGFTPSGVETATFNSAMRLGWRQHKNYGLFSYITYDTHANSYDSLELKGSNVRSGEVWYNEIGISVGYRLPLVANIRSFYQNPYFHPWDIFASIQPGVSIATVKNMVPCEGEQDAFVMKNVNSAVPIVRFSAGVEWFIFSNFAVFAEAAYTQHLVPTVIERAAINQGRILKPTGPVTISVGLSLFFS